MLKVQRSAEADRVVLAVSGRLGAGNVHLLLSALDAESRNPPPLVLALGEVRLVDRLGVAFLARCEAEGVVLQDCPPFIRLWIDRITEDNVLEESEMKGFVAEIEGLTWKN